MTDFPIQDLMQITRQAGDTAMAIYSRKHDVAIKEDNSPVTEADLAVDNLLFPALTERYPEIPVVTEERAATQSIEPGRGRFFLVDPIDGTKEFINKTGEFTINIALIEDGHPVAGIVHAPAAGRMFVGTSSGGAYEIDEDGTSREIRVRACEANLTAVASRSHMTEDTELFISENKIGNCVNAGSSLKFCLVAAGEADIYPRFGPTMEWDTAAGHAVLSAAGGRVLTCDGSPLSYGKPKFRNPYFIAASPTARYTIPVTIKSI
ncbi:3'(2'),5'-bisphosphate nucleotidase CysQ [Oricola thermophila]|uniref:3'(2'),5'-bisphosphate nucleotidase CysQ n=1 Tax=Oricola thermophila TaxID=2742145 RepID=A0A6N1VD12_9HYPH|nr:3'(2'),5'-bisphosphate nucleotidase CysQ [Oricola thermophila]QKV18764.1 3'(2'),5'-bisphosphate nucleotidase CysQ [Oricola thermophila]